MTTVTAHAQAQVRPDAGSTSREVEQRPLEIPRTGPRLSTEPARPALRADESTRFAVASLSISGNVAFDSATLLALVRDELIGKTVSLKQLQDAAAKITAFYRARGYLVARAYIPAQRIAETNAAIEIAVLEGVLGGVKVNNRSRLSDATVARFTAPFSSGAVVTLGTLERPIQLLQDQAGVGEVFAVLGAGAATGESDLTLEIGESPLVLGQMEFDNQGSRFTGANRLSGQVNLLSPFGVGDSFTARLTDSFDGLTSASLRAAVPLPGRLGGDGWKVGGSYTDTRYKLGADFASLQASGDTRATSLFVSYPWVRSLAWNLNTTLAYDGKRFEDRVDSTQTITPKQSRATSLTVSGDVRDPLMANSILVWSATALSGQLDLQEPGARAADAATAQTQGGYHKWSLALLYQQALSSQWTLFGSLSAQRAGKNLDSSEKLSLGGASGVRAYPVGEAAGDEGAQLTTELRYALGDWGGATPSVVLFADAGRVHTNKHAFADGVNARTLGAAGVGFTLAKPADYSVRLYWAAKTTSESATADTDRSGRAWLQAVKFFSYP